ncbi:MAG: hypothetical protein Q4D03_09305 [Bacteroidales bacterium]|nr:hypothetical protein [Bacteroidales bacterium]
MGKIVVKAQQQNVFNKDNSGTITPAYILRPIRYTTMGSDEIIDYCAANSVVPKAYISATVVALAQCIENFLLNGHSVEFPNLGIFSIKTRGTSESDPDKAGLNQLDKVVVNFLPCMRLKNEVEALDLEFDGVYNIAGENSRGEKYYSKVVRSLSSGVNVGDNANANATPSGNSPSGGSTSGSGSQSSTNVTITATANDSAMGSVTGGGTVAKGSTVTLTATPNEGYVFSRWSNGETSRTITFTANADASYVATFGTSGGQLGDD